MMLCDVCGLEFEEDELTSTVNNVVCEGCFEEIGKQYKELRQ